MKNWIMGKAESRAWKHSRITKVAKPHVACNAVKTCKYHKIVTDNDCSSSPTPMLRPLTLTNGHLEVLNCTGQSTPHPQLCRSTLEKSVLYTHRREGGLVFSVGPHFPLSQAPFPARALHLLQPYGTLNQSRTWIVLLFHLNARLDAFQISLPLSFFPFLLCFRVDEFGGLWAVCIGLESRGDPGEWGFLGVNREAVWEIWCEGFKCSCDEAKKWSDYGCGLHHNHRCLWSRKTTHRGCSEDSSLTAICWTSSNWRGSRDEYVPNVFSLRALFL